ncbi:ABC transporter substrate-binding protein [Roseobacter sp. CCS2]|uniref:ABC transporter substrate-binding protein n=1 Tax=Roseobacter sp. CCS2 TaxID=391593 RepID=UPI0000F3F0A2|nr:ABC transporter substrate-binding protein [Roseobacter sp. CCS2]EBA11181.1 probable substrate-binding periplasmic (pbp) abc transporter protein [Roseobacter sp. CCS2]
MKHLILAAGLPFAVLVAGAQSATAETLTIGLAAEPTSIDPHFHNVGPNNAIATHIFDHLVKRDENQQQMPGLAVSWAPIDDLTWEFKLREGVTFHDGSAFNADDVVCTFERAPNVPDSPSSYGTFTKGKTVERIDDFTIHIKTEAPYPLMPNDIANVAIISDDTGCTATTADFNDGSAAIGTGPYRFASFTPGENLTLQRNDDYWDAAPEFETVDYRFLKSGPTRVAALLSGDVDMISGVPTTDIATLQNNDDISLSQGVSNRVIYLHMDQFRDVSPFVTGPNGEEIPNPLRDVRVRQALSMAVSRDAIVDRVMEGTAIKAGQLLPEGFFGISPNLQPVEYDPEGARALLAEAGYPDGFTMTIHGPNDRYINDARIAEALGQMFSRVGIKTSVETMPRSVYFSRASSGSPEGEPEFSFILVGWGAGSGEASSPLRSLVHTYDSERGFGSSNRGRHSNPEIDAIIEQALATVDDAARQDLLAQAMEMAIETVAVIPTHFQVNTWAARDGLSYVPRTDEYTLAMSVTKD